MNRFRSMREPDLEIVEDRGGAGLPKLDTLVRRQTSGLLLDGIEPGDPADGLFGDRRSLGTMDVDELAPDMTRSEASTGSRALSFVRV